MIERLYTNLEQGSLLVASPDVEPGLYSRSVILICEHTPAGSFGLVINKPFNIEIPEEILSIEELSNPKVQLRMGGKMQQNQMMLLHTSEKVTTQTLKVLDGVYLGGDLNFLQENLKNESSPDILLCFGYTGWITGQLEKEFMAGMWYPYPANKEIIFDTPIETIWRTVLRSMGGKYTTISMIPEDLSLN
jgi:putative transcriptional regulator